VNSKQVVFSKSWIPAIFVTITTLLLGLIFALCDGEQITRNTVRLSLFWYAAAYFLLVTGSDFLRFRLIRWFWTLGLVCYLIHVAVAFHYYHQWSHGLAVAHTQRTSGFGSGIFASYLFSLVWMADVATAWRRPTAYASRTRSRQMMIHGFLLFMVVNGAIVFASGPTQWISVVIFASIVAAWWRNAKTRPTKGDAKKGYASSLPYQIIAGVAQAGSIRHLNT